MRSRLFFLSVLLIAVGLSAKPQTPRPTAVVHLKSPNYGIVARQARIQGDVTLVVHIGPDGEVKQVSGKSGEPILIHDAELNVRTWAFNKGHEVTTEITYEFRLIEPEIYCQPPSSVTFDLPDRVRITSNYAMAMPD